MIRRIVTALAAVMLVSACDEIGAPRRADFYEWRLIVPPQTGPGLDTLSFHWSVSDLPVRIWAEDSLDLPRRMQDAIASWKAQFLYGEFDGVIVSDSLTADVIARVGQAPATLHGLQLERLAPECRGVTIPDISDDHTLLVLPLRIYVDPRFAPGAPGVDACLDLTVKHELGHALGLFAHSDEATDLMFGDPVVAEPSTRDRNTIERAYHRPSSLALVGRP